MDRNRDLISAIDKRARDRIDDYRMRHEFDIGTIKAMTFSGACITFGGSGRYLRNVQSLQGTEVTIGDRVMCSRIGREPWTIIGAIERDNAITPTTENLNVVPQPQNVQIEDKGGYIVIEHTEALVSLGVPVLVGPSRKRFIGEITGVVSEWPSFAKEADVPRDRIETIAKTLRLDLV